MKRLFLILTWIAALALTLAISSACIVNCCVLRAAMPHCGAMAKMIAEKPLQDAMLQQKTGPVLQPVRAIIAIYKAVPLPPPVTARTFGTPGALRADRDVGLHILLATLLI